MWPRSWASTASPPTSWRRQPSTTRGPPTSSRRRWWSGSSRPRHWAGWRARTTWHARWRSSPATRRASRLAPTHRSTAAWRWTEPPPPATPGTASRTEGAISMETLDLAFVGRGIHEELVAYIADQEGYFEEEGVHVALRDAVAWNTERLRRCATIGLGRSMLSRLTEGIPWTGLSVNTHRPLFWFLGRGDLESLQDLKGRRLAVHSPPTAPGCFARIVLRRAGLDPDRDLT